MSFIESQNPIQNLYTPFPLVLIAETRLCAVNFLKEDERGEHLFPGNSEGVLTWSKDEETYVLHNAIQYYADDCSLLEAFSCLFRLRALSNCASQKGPWYKKTKERKLQTQNSDAPKTPYSQDKKRVRSSEVSLSILFDIFQHMLLHVLCDTKDIRLAISHSSHRA